jgi:hypothetical protein
MTQHHQDALSYYQRARQRVKDTPPPEGQKFKPGTRVKIAKNLGPHMSHFPCDKMATVLYTYAHAYQSDDERSLKQYCLDIDGIGEVSWYEEDQLTAHYVN